MPKHYKKKYKKKTSFLSKAQRVAGTAYKAYQIAKFVKSVVNVEKKKIDFTYDAELLNTGNVLHCNAIGVGTGYNARTGNSIKMKTLLIRGTLRVATTTPTDRDWETEKEVKFHIV